MEYADLAAVLLVPHRGKKYSITSELNLVDEGSHIIISSVSSGEVMLLPREDDGKFGIWLNKSNLENPDTIITLNAILGVPLHLISVKCFLKYHVYDVYVPESICMTASDIPALNTVALNKTKSYILFKWNTTRQYYVLSEGAAKSLPYDYKKLVDVQSYNIINTIKTGYKVVEELKPSKKPSVFEALRNL